MATLLVVKFPHFKGSTETRALVAFPFQKVIPSISLSLCINVCHHPIVFKIKLAWFSQLPTVFFIQLKLAIHREFLIRISEKFTHHPVAVPFCAITHDYEPDSKSLRTAVSEILTTR